MAAMSTVFNNFANYGDTRTYFTSGHTAQKVKLVTVGRKTPKGNQIIGESSIAVSHATEDDDGLVLSARPTITITVRGPITGQTTDMDAVKAIVRDFVAADEFDDLVDKSAFPAGTA
jgi:hypothetical protein